MSLPRTSQRRGSLLLPTRSPNWFRSSSTSGDLAVVLGFVGCFGTKFAADS